MKLSAIIFLSLIFTSCTIAQSSRNSNAIPSKLIGKWYSSEMSNTQYSDRATGENNTAAGANASLEFRSDGSFVAAKFARAQVYGCETTVYNYNPGKFSFKGNVITFMPTDEELVYKSSCSPNLNSDKHRPPVKSANEFAFKTENEIEYLCFSDDTGKEGCWRRLES